MGRLVEIAAGYRGVALPDGGVYSSGDQVTLSDEQYADVPLAWIGTILTDLGSAPDPSTGHEHPLSDVDGLAAALTARAPLLVLDAADPVPPGTAAGTVIVRRTS